MPQTSDAHDNPVPVPSEDGPVVSQAVDVPVDGDAVPPVRRRRLPGLLEALVACSVLVSLSGVVMPVVAEGAQNARLQDANEGVQGIADALRDYSSDTLFLPTGARGRTNLSWLYGPGEMPTDNSFAEGGEARSLDDFLVNDAMGGGNWNGPYVADLQADPWGQAYLVNVDGWLDLRERALVLSAGPNGRVETSPYARAAGGDDVVFLMD